MEIDNKSELNNVFNYLIKNSEICFKNQQRGEADFTEEEKLKIVKEIHDKSKTSFLLRFGKYMTKDHLDIFMSTGTNTDEDEEAKLLLANLIRAYTETSKGLKAKNRRYEAMKQLISKNSYFSEVEMMKRNPLLYEQLVGQYLNEEEKRDRDRMEDKNSLVKILLEGMERDEAFDRKKLQEEAEDDAMEESDSDEDEDVKIEVRPSPKPSTSRWGEFEEMQERAISQSGLFTKNQRFITKQEQQLLREEFTSIMYANFLNGHDDFDYTTVDNNDAYDNIEILGKDEEEKYFDSEEPENVSTAGGRMEDESSEDELDIYMNALNQHPTVIELSKDIAKM